MQELCIHSFVIRYQQIQLSESPHIKVKVVNVQSDTETYFDSLYDAYQYMEKVIGE
ncbi:hypothetical protein [Alkalibacillus haloalkaliphilus]|uniref:Uncharacterized protein n=1 Tax=Alkalibacillus haloalkaliphilus TaxID=94136 RepID=A0A511W193_9BACI|nr:hypothetical protein [Alkalibacillus haloalkaliphilus]MDV2582524.1 hypothetical protein [Alkalibacillus haloalkaliphilus]GEN44797.1 hypothetical protein AHA02nite_05730 [Alkalibacillus haloalkaliphilus]